MVATRRRGKPRVELVTDGLCPGNVDIVRKVAVCAQQPAPAAALTVCVQMHDLAGRVHAGVCSTGANELDGFVRDLA